MKLANSTMLIVFLAIASVATAGLVALNVAAHVGRTPDRGAVRQESRWLNPGIELPAFTLTDQTNQPFGLKELRGKVWIADFIFTRCPGICPAMTAKMSKIHDQLLNNPTFSDVILVSISVDPNYDTPQRLAEYAEGHKADPRRWRFLTGQRQVIWDLCRNGFKQPVEENADNAAIPIYHGPYFILVDRSATIRRFYDSSSPEAIAALGRDLERLAHEGLPIGD